jgi:hypothetical protein
MIIALTYWGCLSDPADDGRVEIDTVEGEVVRAFAPANGRALTLKRSVLPAHIREGDVVVDGRTDPALEAELRAEVARARRTLGPPERGSFDLGNEPLRVQSGQAREPSRVQLRPVGAPPRAEHSPSLTDPVEP